MRQLIVNADDFNLTEGVSAAILLAHDRGIISSASVMANLPLSQFQVKGLLKRNLLGAGLHLNVTRGFPVCPRNKVRSLTASNGHFQSSDLYRYHHFDSLELECEFEAQIRRFASVFGKLPGHLNTHHHIHAFPPVFQIVSALAEKYHIPIRRTSVVAGAQVRARAVTTDYLYGSLKPKKYWQEESLKAVLKSLPPGTSEIMCHPGFVDSDLIKKSSMTHERQLEFQLFSNPRWRDFLRHENIQLINFEKNFSVVK